MISRSGGFVLVEGTTDKLFIERVMLSKLVRTQPGLYVKVVEHAQRPSKLVRSVLGTSARMGIDCVFVADLDDLACCTLGKAKCRQNYPFLDESCVVIVKREIESWYLAGLDVEASATLGVQYLPTTDDVTKEDFARLRPKRFRDNLDFMLEILNRFDLGHALRQNRNTSLTYFCARHCDLDGLVA